MSIAAVRPAPDLLRRVVRLQMLTIVWMSIEAVVALVAAWTARSPAVLGFGGDSAIELFSAVIVLARFRSKPDSAAGEKLAARVAGGLLFFVAAFVIISSGLSLLSRASSISATLLAITNSTSRFISQSFCRSHTPFEILASIAFVV